MDCLSLGIMIQVGKIFILIGISFLIIGLVLVFGAKIPYFGRLPGDIYIKKDNFTLYAPIVSFLILSIILSVIVNLLLKIFKK